MEGLSDDAARRLRLGGAAAAAVLGAFTFTNWQNSNETEVYTVATFTIAAMSLGWRMLWRSRRGTERAPRFLLLIIYLAGISIGNHLLALLAGPGVLVFLVATLRHQPAGDPARRRAEWGQVAVVAGVWALLVGTGLGSAVAHRGRRRLLPRSGALRRGRRGRDLRRRGLGHRRRGRHALCLHLPPLGPAPGHQRGRALDIRCPARGHAARPVSAPHTARRPDCPARSRTTPAARSRS